jgi:hypothetical protein
MKKFLLVFLLCLGCESREEVDERVAREAVDYLSDNVAYYKDTRSNLCFAGMDIKYRTATFTSVACTPEVEKVARSFTSKL